VIPFYRPSLVGTEWQSVKAACEQAHLSGNGPFTKRCEQWLEARTGCTKALLTHSCTAALEMAALLLDCGPGDEVIMPSFAFVSTANAFVLRGATPVFVDVHPDSLTIDPACAAAAVTRHTKAIVALHYAGVACDMDALLAIAQQHRVAIVEDAAQGLLASYRGRPLGSIGTFGTFSFHETKNVISGEGGALLVNEARFVDRAEILWEKGTNRHQFFRGEVDKYTWVDIGSSFLPSEIVAAFLHAQLQAAEQLTSKRLRWWQAYHKRLAELEAAGWLRRPIVPDPCRHNAHTYHVLIRQGIVRADLLSALRADGVGAAFHYVPLHSSPAGRRYGRTAGSLAVTEDLSDRIVRLPLWADMTHAQVETVVDVLHAVLRQQNRS
jgi:dTDP-4-amino-4,6-dideoxygalactose transaminase